MKHAVVGRQLGASSQGRGGRRQCEFKRECDGTTALCVTLLSSRFPIPFTDDSHHARVARLFRG
jgi:hypothetical protein